MLPKFLAPAEGWWPLATGGDMAILRNPSNYHGSKVFSLKDRGLVLNLATRPFVGTVVYPRGLWGKFQGGFAFYPMSLKCLV